MKIAFVIHHVHKLGGQERSTLEIINRFAQSHHVHVFVYSAEGLHPSVVVHKIPLLISKPFFLKEFLFRIFASLMLLGKNFDIINATGNCCFQPNVITVQFCQRKWWKERKKLKVGFGPRALLSHFQSVWDVFWEWLIFSLHRRALYIALSPEVATDLKQYYKVENIEIIPHGVDIKEFAPSHEVRQSTRRELQVKDDETLVLFVGSFERKGLGFLLLALSKLPSQFKIKLCVVGMGPVKKFERVAKKLDLWNIVRFVGPTSQVNRYYRAADLFILPSLYDPFGLVGIEALASGLPSIVSIQSGVSHVIRPGHNGLLLSRPESSDEIKSTLEMILSDAKLRDLMRTNARQSVLNYTWENIWPLYEKAFIAHASHGTI